jgi:hypothetical protein
MYCLTAVRFGLSDLLQGDIPDTAGRNSNVYIPSRTIKTIKIRNR